MYEEMQLQHLHKHWFWPAGTHTRTHTAGDEVTRCVGESTAEIVILFLMLKLSILIAFWIS